MSDDALATKSLQVGWGTLATAQVGDLSIPRRQVTVVAGPNGAGKSTLLKTIVRQLRPLSGLVTIGGADIWSMSETDFAKRVAYVPQLMDVARHLTVYEWAALGRNPHQRWWSWQMSDHDRQLVQQSLERTSTWDLRERLVHTLSGGERQRVFIAMALAQESDYLVLDEPTAHLDFRHQLELTSLFRELADEGLGILLVLHDLNLMARVADQLIFLKSEPGSTSKVVCAGPKEKVLEPVTLRKVYDVEVEILLDARTGVTGFIPTRVTSP